MTKKLCAAATAIGMLAGFWAGLANAAGPGGNDKGGGHGGPPAVRDGAPGPTQVAPAPQNINNGRSAPALNGTPDADSRNQVRERREDLREDRADNRLEIRNDRRGAIDNRVRDRVNARGDDWRFTYHNNQWWYWLPDNRWVIWYDGRWVDYDPATYAQYSSPMPYRAGYGGDADNDNGGTDDWYYDDGDYYYYRRRHDRGNETFNHDNGNVNRGGENFNRGNENRVNENRGNENFKRGNEIRGNENRGNENRGNENFNRGPSTQQPNTFPPPGTRRADAHLDEQE